GRAPSTVSDGGGSASPGSTTSRRVTAAWTRTGRSCAAGPDGVAATTCVAYAASARSAATYRSAASGVAPPSSRSARSVARTGCAGSRPGKADGRSAAIRASPGSARYADRASAANRLAGRSVAAGSTCPVRARVSIAVASIHGPATGSPSSPAYTPRTRSTWSTCRGSGANSDQPWSKTGVIQAASARWATEVTGRSDSGSSSGCPVSHPGAVQSTVAARCAARTAPTASTAARRRGETGAPASDPSRAVLTAHRVPDAGAPDPPGQPLTQSTVRSRATTSTR